MGLQRFPVSDFRGGLNTKDGPFGLESNEAQSLLNVTLTRRGVLAQRSGKTRFDFSGISDEAQHLRPWYFGSTRLLMASTNGDIRSVDTGGEDTLRFDGTAGTIWHFEQATDSTGADRLWALNGSNTPKKWDGATALVSDWANNPPNGTMMRLWKNRMCISGVAATPQRLFFSDIGNPESPAATYGTNWVDIKSTDDDLDPITWIETLGNDLVVFKKQSVWVVYDSNTFQNRRLGGPGCEGRFMTCVSDGRVYFFNRAGVWSTNGIQPPRMETAKIENFISDNLNYTHIAKVRLCASRDRRIFVAMPFTTSTVNDRLFELLPGEEFVSEDGTTDVREGAWTVHSYPVGALCTFRPSTQDVLVAAHSGQSRLHILFQGSDDDGDPIQSHWQGSWRPLISEEPYERIRRVNIEMAGRLQLKVYKDFEDNPAFQKVMDASSALTDPLWDGGVWDGGIWSLASEVQLVRARPETRGRYHSIRVENNEIDKSFTIYAIELALRGGKEH